jgi:hypothetical protein
MSHECGGNRMKHKTDFTSIAVMLLTVLLLGTSAPGCKEKATPEERLTWDRVEPMIGWLEDFNVSNQRYPNNWDELLRWKGLSMPVNPYTNQPMVCLDSSEFDPQKSPGNFYYARVIRDEQVINFQLLVFGDDGVVVRYSHSPMAPR